MTNEIVRVVRLLEYTGPREVVEEQLGRSLGDGLRTGLNRYYGNKVSPVYGKGVNLRIATLPASTLTESEEKTYELEQEVEVLRNKVPNLEGYVTYLEEQLKIAETKETKK